MRTVLYDVIRRINIMDDHGHWDSEEKGYYNLEIKPKLLETLMEMI